MNILVSACLLGVNVRYDGTSMLKPELASLMKEHHLIPICPEILGGMETPREPAERVEDKVLTRAGKDVTLFYTKGANEVLKLAKLFDCTYAILKERSPSCGYGEIYDGSFTHKIVDGNGVLADLLSKEDIIVLGESRIKELL